jgi:hypothetical protein
MVPPERHTYMSVAGFSIPRQSDSPHFRGMAFNPIKAATVMRMRVSISENDTMLLLSERHRVKRQKNHPKFPLVEAIATL